MKKLFLYVFLGLLWCNVSLASAELIFEYNEKLLNKKLKKRAEEAEGELTIIKGIGNSSPEMKTLQKEVEELKADLARAKEDHQYDNLVHQKELNDLRKK